MTTALEPARTVTSDQLDLIRRTIAAGATPDELLLFLHDCQRQRVHPLDKLLHFTKRKGKYTPITSIDFMRTRAAETGEYAGSDDAVFRGAVAGTTYPEAATVTVWRLVQGQRCAFTATARWGEYKPEGYDLLWQKMPHTMLSKCAEALALRKGFPRQLAGLYAAEEFDQAETAAPGANGPAPAPVVAAETGEEVPAGDAPMPPPGFYYVSGYAFNSPWHEALLVHWGADGSSLKVSTKLEGVGKLLAKADARGLPIKAGDAEITHKANRKGEAYLNKVTFYDAGTD